MNSANGNHLLRVLVQKLVQLPFNKPPGRATVASRLTYHLFVLPKSSGTLLQAGKRVVNIERSPTLTNGSHESCKPNDGGSVARAPQDAPGSMMHGASISVLHITPPSLIMLLQQDDCGPSKGRGMLSSEGLTSTHVHCG